MERTNVFAHFQDKPASHEDRLTRAFLTVLRLVPPAHALFLDLIKCNRGSTEPELPNLWELVSGSSDPVYRSQVRSVGHEVARLVSVLLTDVRPEELEPVRLSERTAVYDGVISYPSGWVFIVENKPDHRAVWQGQLSPGMDMQAEEEEIEETVVVVEWKEILSSWNGLLGSKLLGYTEETLLRDFLELVGRRQLLLPTDDNYMYPLVGWSEVAEIPCSQ